MPLQLTGDNPLDFPPELSQELSSGARRVAEWGAIG